MNETYRALQRESGLAAEHMAIGATALGKVNHAQPAYYAQAFFALTIGFERSAKLVLVVDHALQHSGDFPANKTLRRYGHDLKQLLGRVDEVAKRRKLPAEYRLPRTAIHDTIVEVLSDFANNVTRYYNLDVVTGVQRAAGREDPVQAWSERVVTPILDRHCGSDDLEALQSRAMRLHGLIGGHTSVYHHTESGDVLDDVYSATFHASLSEFARAYARMYTMQIARFLARVLSHMGGDLSSETIPYLPEFFATFDNSDGRLLTREEWSSVSG